MCREKEISLGSRTPLYLLQVFLAGLVRLQLQGRTEEESGLDTTCTPLRVPCLALRPCINVDLNACGNAGSPV